MAEEQLNLNATQFVDELDRAIRKVNEFQNAIQALPGHLRGQAKASTQAGKKTQDYTQSVHKNQQAQKAAADATKQTTKVLGDQSVQIVGITLRYKELFKLVMARVVTLMFHQLQSQARQSIKDMRDLEVALLELQTIAGEMEQGAQGIAMMHREISEMSRQFGIARLDIVDAQYQALSSSIGDSTREIETFTREMIRFSKVTATTLPDSVGLAASILNSFNMSVLETNRVMAVMFGMIREGRLRAEEVANTFGRVTASAEAVGVSFEEVSATMAIMTRGGVRAREAMTALNAILEQFIQPSEQLTQVFRQWGVTSGEAAIATFGFTGVMERFGDIVREDGIQALGELVTQKRALRGILLALNPELEELTQEYQDAAKQAEEYGDIIEQRLNAPAEEFDRQMQRIRMGFDAIGQSAINSVHQLSKWGFGLSSILELLVKWGALFAGSVAATHAYNHAVKASAAATVKYNAAVKAAITAKAGLQHQTYATLGSWMAYEAQVHKATIATSGLTKATVGLKMALSGVVAVLKSPAFLAFAAVGTYMWWTRRLRREEERYLETLEKRAEAQEKILGQMIAMRREAYQERIQPVLEENAELLADANEKLEAAETLWLVLEYQIEESNKQLEQSLEATEEWINKLEGVRDKYRNIADEARKSLEDLQMDFLFEEFDRRLKRMDPLQQLDARFGFATELAREAERAFAAGDPEAMRNAFSEAHRMLQEANRQAQDIGFIPGMTESERALRQLFQMRQAAEMEIISAAEREATLRDQELQHHKNIAQQKQNQITAQEEILGITGNILDVLRDSEMSEARKQIHLAHYGKQLNAVGNMNVWNNKLLERAGELHKERVQAAKDELYYQRQSAGLRAEALLAEEKRTAEDRIDEIYGERGKMLTDAEKQISEMEKTLGREEKIAQALRVIFGTAEVIRPLQTSRLQAIDNTQQALENLGPTLEKAREEMDSFDGAITQETTNRLAEMIEILEGLPEEMLRDLSIDIEEPFSKMLGVAKELVETTKEEAKLRGEIADYGERITQSTTDRARRQRERESLTAVQGINEAMQEIAEGPLERRFLNLEVEGIANNLERGAVASERMWTALDRIGGLTHQLGQLRPDSPFAPGFAKGGSIVDNTPAMLSKGEEVVRAGPAAAYRSALKGMNVSNRMMPVSQSRGIASSTNTTHAQINVTDSGSPQLTSKQVMYHLNRAQQRGIA